MFSTSSILARGKAAVAGSETEQRLAVLLYDDAVQVISTLELHQLATFTYQESQVITSSTADLRDIILDHLEKIQKRPAQYSTLTVLKSLVVTRHLLLFGSDRLLPTITQQLGAAIDDLRQNYNTVLMAQQQHKSWMLRIQGGGVDAGGPVRELATKIVTLLQHPTTLLLHERHRVADPHSLVPVGERTQVGWGSDQLRYEQLQAQVQREQAMHTRSNLVKADNGFGSGYSAANGQTVVGAAHGIDEMLAQQRKVEQQFKDDAVAAAAARSGTTTTTASFSEYQAPDLLQTTAAAPPATSSVFPAPTPAVDLLDFGAPVAPMPTPMGDLLGSGATPSIFGAVTTTTTTPAADPFAPTAPPMTAADDDDDNNNDPFGFASPPPTQPVPAQNLMAMPPSDATPVLLGMPTTVAPPTDAPTASGVVPHANDPIPTPTTKPVVMGGGGGAGSSMPDPFAALNGVGTTTQPTTTTTSSFQGLGTTVPPTTSLGGAGTMNNTTAFDGLGSVGTTNNTPSSISLSSIQVGGGTIQSAAVAADTDDSNNNSAFLMGGGTGTGMLQDAPLGPPPMGAPPPPPLGPPPMGAPPTPPPPPSGGGGGFLY